MNTNFFVAEDEVFNPNKVLTRKEIDASFSTLSA